VRYEHFRIISIAVAAAPVRDVYNYTHRLVLYIMARDVHTVENALFCFKSNSTAVTRSLYIKYSIPPI